MSYAFQKKIVFINKNNINIHYVMGITPVLANDATKLVYGKHCKEDNIQTSIEKIIRRLLISNYKSKTRAIYTDYYFQLGDIL